MDKTLRAAHFIIIMISLFAVCASGSMIERIGKEIRASLSGVDVPGVTFLQKDIVLADGIVFAYSAFFRSNKPVRLQIWRPLEGQANDSDSNSISHRLLAETRVLPSLILGREDVYIESRITEKCIRVKEGDRLGVMFEESPSAVAYVFDDESPTALANRLQNASDPHQLNDVVMFDALLFPYDFSVAAYVDVDPSHYAAASPDEDFVDCFPLVTIPDQRDLEELTTTVVPPTGAPGATGATGPIGATGYQGPAGIAGPAGAAGAVGATGAVGAAGAAGIDGTPGATGARGPAGVKGDTGTQGERGDQGPRGPPGVVVVDGDSASTGGSLEGSSNIMGTDTPLAYLIWLIILSICIIILVILIIYILLRRRRSSQAAYAQTETMSNASYDKRVGCWKNFLKDEIESNYSNSMRKGLANPAAVDLEAVERGEGYPPSPRGSITNQSISGTDHLTATTPKALTDEDKISYSGGKLDMDLADSNENSKSANGSGSWPESMGDQNDAGYQNDTIQGGAPLGSQNDALQGGSNSQPENSPDTHEFMRDHEDASYSNDTIQDRNKRSKSIVVGSGVGGSPAFSESMRDGELASFSNDTVQDPGRSKRSPSVCVGEGAPTGTNKGWEETMQEITESAYSNDTIEGRGRKPRVFSMDVGGPADRSWTDTMKSESETIYTNDTLTRDGK